MSRRTYGILLGVSWLSCCFALGAPERTRTLNEEAVVPMTLVWLPVLIICSVSIRRRWWLPSARLGHIFLTVALVAITINSVSMTILADVLRKPLEGVAWTTVYILGLGSLLIAPAGLLLTYVLSRPGR